MKTSLISSLSVSNALRLTMSQAQRDLMRASQESLSGKHYDLGVALAEKTAQSLDMNREVDRLKSLSTANSLVTTRLSSSQAALESMADSGQDILNTILAFGGNIDKSSIETSKTTIRSALSLFTEKANMSVNGEYLFSGINTDVQPMADFLDPASPARVAFDSAVSGFLTANGLTDKSQMSASQMTTLLGNLETMFNGTYWTGTASQASATNMTSRISKNEVVQTSVNTNADGMRHMVLGAMVALEFMDVSMPADVRSVVKSAAENHIATGIADLTGQRGRLGVSEERVKKANESIEAQKKIISDYLMDLEGIDVPEAATRVKNLQSLVDASYTLTARLQQLSLVNFL